MMIQTTKMVKKKGFLFFVFNIFIIFSNLVSEEEDHEDEFLSADEGSNKGSSENTGLKSLLGNDVSTIYKFNLK